MTEPQNQALQVCLDRLEWRPESLAARVNEYARKHKINGEIHPKTPYAWLFNNRHPRRPWADLVAAVLSEHLGRTVTPTELGWESAREPRHIPADTGLDPQWNSHTAIAALAEIGSDQRMDRRRFLVTSGATLSGAAHTWMLSNGVAAADEVSEPADSATLDGIGHIVDSLRRRDDTYGGPSVLESSGSELEFVVDQLRSGRHKTEGQERLFGYATELARLQAWAFFDLGDYGRAQRAYLAALRSAHSSHNLALGVNVLSFLTFQESVTGDPQTAVKLARSAHLGAGNSLTSADRAALLAHEACAAAAANDGHALAAAADSALHEAEKANEIPEYVYWVSPYDASGICGQAFLRHGDLSRAKLLLKRAVGSCGPSQRRENALWRSDLARIHVKEGDLELACATGTEVLDLAVGVRSPRLATSLGQLRQEMRVLHRKTAAVKDFDEQVTAFLKAYDTKSAV